MPKYNTKWIKMTHSQERERERCVFRKHVLIFCSFEWFWDILRVWCRPSCSFNTKHKNTTWGRGWMTKASGVGERRKGRGELRRDCHHRVAALFVPTRMQQWYMIYEYIYIWYITMIYMGEGAGGGPFAWKITWCPWGAPEYLLKQEDSS